MKFTLKDLQNLYPDDDTCLGEIWGRKYETITCVRCGRVDAYTRITTRMAYSCVCGHQVYPLVGTIFERSTTPLTTWFYVIYIMSQTKSGVSAAYIQRVTGVAYNTAWRMMHKIRQLMIEDDTFEGEVEIDETFLKAKPWRNTRTGQTKADFFRAPIVFGMVERESGRVKTEVLPNLKAWTVRDVLTRNVVEGSTIYSDGSHSYELVRRHYIHIPRVHWNISSDGANAFIPGEGTQKIENFWSQFKRGVIGVYRNVSRQYLQAYADEYAWRYSNRNSEVSLFDLLMERI